MNAFASFFRRLKKGWLLIPFVSLILFGFTFFKDKEFDIVKNLDIFYSLFRELNMFYVDETDPKALIESGIEGMLGSLDPYTTYIPEEESDEFSFMTTGEYGGIGALIRRGGHYTIISEPYEGFPAQKAGLRAGDTLISINGTNLKERPINEVSDMLKGTPNTTVKLLLKRMGESFPVEKEIVREKVTISNIPYFGMVEGSVGYIRLSGFTKGADQEAQEAVKQLLNMGASSIILDLRGNPGGLLDESVTIANLFVRKGEEIVSTKGKVKQWDKVYKTQNQPVDSGIPLVVLVSRASASASEIIAGALQDLDRAVIVGQKTFGKGLVQTTRPLSYNAQLKVTAAKYYIPSGRCIQAVDYTHRNADGSVGFIPDSLIRAYKTRNGRTVYDGGGISPDVVLEPETPGNITISLFTGNLIFDYATLYASTHPEFTKLHDPVMAEFLFNDFVNYLKNKSYDYSNESNDKLDELIETAKKERYFTGAETEFNALRAKLSHNKATDLQTFKMEITSLLLEEIASRYYYQKGRIRASLINDKEVKKAIEICENKNLYSSILQGIYLPALK